MHLRCCRLYPLAAALLAAACGETPPPAERDVAPAAALAGAGPFVEVARDSGLDFVHFNGMTGHHYFAEMMGAGAALFDADGDGDLDLYLVQGGPLDDVPPPQALYPPHHPLPLTDRLYRNLLAESGHLAFSDVTEESGLAATGYGMGVATGDADGDGAVDLYVTNLGTDQLWKNLGDGRFGDVSRAAGIDDHRWSVPAVLFDRDGDGDLDLFVGHYVDYRVSTDKGCSNALGAPSYCGPLAFPAVADRLLDNDGHGRFVDVTAAAGLDTAFGRALGAGIADFDGDGRLDLYVANDGTPNQLWKGHPAGFVDEALLAGVAVDHEGRPQASMGVAIADADADGDEDLFLTHLNGETNTLYLNDGEGLFTEATAAAGLGPPSLDRTGFGTGWLDFDGDGRLDLLVVNGAVRTLEELVAAGDPFPLHQPNQLYRQAPGGRFTEIDGGLPLALSEVSRGAAFGDVDNDGDTDVVVTQNNGPVRLLLNRAPDDGHWLGLSVRLASGADAIGALVTLERPAGPSLVSRVVTSCSYASSCDPRRLFRLAGGEPVGAVVVRWPDGSEERFPPPPVGLYSTLERGKGSTP